MRVACRVIDARGSANVSPCSFCVQVFPKDRIRGIYDGSIFYLTAQRLEGGAAKQA